MEIKPHQRSTCIIHFKMELKTYDLLTELPGFSKWEDRALVFRPTSANVEYLTRHFPEALWKEGTDVHVRDLAERNRIANEIRAGKLHLDIDDNHEYKLKPWAHQRTAFLLSREREAFALLMEQRTGKTKVVIDTASYLFKRKKIHTLIIVSVNGVHRNWIDNEVPKHMPDWCKWNGYFHRSNKTRKQVALFEKVLDDRSKLRIFAFHIEGFSGASVEMFEAAMGDAKKLGAGVLLAIDESTRIKNRSANRTKYITRIGSHAVYRRILTGTPIVKDATDVFAQFSFLDPDILGYDTMTAFKKHFCTIKTFAKDGEGNFKLVNPENEEHIRGPRFEKITGVKNAEELANLIDGFSYRVLRSQCMDLPPKIYKRYPVEMTAEQKRLYKELLEEYIAEFNGTTVSAALAMVRAIRLQQVLCNWWPMATNKLEGGENWKDVAPISAINPRIEATKNIVASTEDKVIIWAAFRPDLKLLQETFGARAVSYHGGVSEDDRARNYWRFQNDPKAEIFLGNPAGGIGIELAKAGTMIYYSNRFNLEHRLQSEDRAEKEGKKDSTAIWDLEVPGTQDTKIIRNLKGKKNIADLINRDPRSYFMETMEEFNRENG